MTEFVDTYPTARTRHRCGLCHRVIKPGETYWRQAGLDHGRAWTNKTCAHCERVVYAYCRTVGESEWMEEDALDWLRDDHPALFAAPVQAGHLRRHLRARGRCLSRFDVADDGTVTDVTP